MQQQIIECVPNFSEGRNKEIIDKIAAAIVSVKGLRLLNIDAGEATNRTVYTFVGEVDAVVEAAFRAVKVASELIDMRHQSGTHPRLGATDVLPLIPISGITLEQCAELARTLAKRITDELSIPSYCYEAAAFRPSRRNLATCRKGEYEALPQRVNSIDDAPDFGARAFDEIIARSGAINIGARDFLIAVNFNLDTKSKKIASQIASAIRENGSEERPWKLKACKAIGWYIEEYGIAQVSMNLTQISVTPLHVVFDRVSLIARDFGVNVTGTEIIGLVPQSALLAAGRHYCTQDNLSDEELIDLAIRSMNLGDLQPFDPAQKVLGTDYQ